MASEPYDWDGVEERLIDLLEATGRIHEWEELRRRHPRPPLPSAFSAFKPDHTLSATHVKPDTDSLAGNAKRTALMPSSHPDAKVGRNDPCPCGSGRKYKKCCLARA